MWADGMQVGVSEALTRDEAVRLAERYVGAYNDRDLDAMLALQDESVMSYPAPLFGHRPNAGHAVLLHSTSFDAQRKRAGVRAVTQ